MSFTSTFLRQVGRAIKAKKVDMETRDGFQVSQNPFTLPAHSANLEPQAKRCLSICNLFVNHWLPIDEIANLLEEGRGRVILALIDRKIIHDRRHEAGGAPQGEERRTTSSSIPEHPTQQSSL